MVREDILAALRNAVERNESIEDAKQSLVNSGYTLQEVEEAICVLMSEERESPLSVIQEKVPLPPGAAIPLPVLTTTVYPVPPKTEKQGLFAKLMKDKTLLILIGVFFVVIIAAGVTLFLMS